MGFALFDQSDVFNPLDYGLNVGDILYVTAIGGGGGGAAGYKDKTALGGTGGPTSFGSYISAPGGSGGGIAGDPSGIGTIGTYLGSSTGGGAGGWFPGWDTYTGSALPSLMAQIGYQSAYMYAPKTLAGWGVSEAGWATNYEAQSSTTITILTYARNVLFETGAIVRPMKRTGYATGSSPSVSSTPYAYWFCQTAASVIGGGFAPFGRMYTSHFNGSNQTSSNMESHGGAVGGLGYGAGGAGGASCYVYNSASNYGSAAQGAGGNSGVLVSKMIKLTSTSVIPVSVGGGGAGGYGCYYTSNAAYQLSKNGADGTAGAGGAGLTINGKEYGKGGYGSTPGGEGYTHTSAALNLSNPQTIGGGGAGGCVAIWW